MGDLPSIARALEAASIVAVVRDKEASRAEEIVGALLAAGVRALEVTAPTPGCFDLLKKHAGSGAVLGVGTVVEPIDVARAAAAGAQFIVAPNFDPAIIAAAHDAGMVAIPGAMTPTEIYAAHKAGAEFVKIFPISAIGGAKFVRLLRGPLPNIPLWVSGSVAIEEIPEYLDAGVKLIGLTNALTGGDPAQIGARVAQALSLKRSRTLLLIEGPGGRKIEVDAASLAALPAAEHVALSAMIPGRRGDAVRLRSLLERAGIPRDAELEVASEDGSFTRSSPAAALYDGGLLHHATDGAPLSREAGGPLRLYVAGGVSGCDNVKALARIAVRG